MAGTQPSCSGTARPPAEQGHRDGVKSVTQACPCLCLAIAVSICDGQYAIFAWMVTAWTTSSSRLSQSPPCSALPPSGFLGLPGARMAERVSGLRENAPKIGLGQGQRPSGARGHGDASAGGNTGGFACLENPMPFREQAFHSDSGRSRCPGARFMEPFLTWPARAASMRRSM